MNKTLCILVAILPVLQGGPVLAQATSTLCHFTAGALAGTDHDYAPLAAVPVGSPCHDIYGSSGTVIANTSAAPTKPPASGTPSSGMTLKCKFTSGKLTGATTDFTGMAGVTPIPVGSFCTDGLGDTGTGV